MLLTTAAEMRELDRRTMAAGTPGSTLMRRAGLGATKVLLDCLPQVRRHRTVIVCGKGNNGGDGFVMARELKRLRAPVEVFLLGSAARVAGDAALALQAWTRAGGKLREVHDSSQLGALQERLNGAGCTVDALLGTGLAGEVGGLAADLITLLNACGAPIFAVDIPSGLDADRGIPLGHAVQAEVTATFGLPKIGQVLHPGSEHCGRLVVVDIGLSEEALAIVAPRARLLDGDEIAPHLPHREPAAHKGDYGHVLVVAGSRGKSGACALAARAAGRGGAGLVTAATPASEQPIVAAAVIEAMTQPMPDTGGELAFDAGRLAEVTAGKTVVVCGPGLGTGEGAGAAVDWLRRTWRGPIVFDADALNCLSPLRDGFAGQAVLTPHPGEMSRLAATPTAEIQRDRAGVARAFATEHRCVLVLKGAGTVIAAPDGRVAVNPTGNPGMASGGMGDVLAGLVGALLGQGLAPFDAACAGAYLHGLAADLVAAERGTVGLLAGDVVEALPRARRQVERAWSDGGRR